MKKRKKVVPMFAVITAVQTDGMSNMYDDIGYTAKDEYKDPVVVIPDELPKGLARKRMVHVKLPAFTLGEILIVDGRYGRELDGDGRAPRKWGVEYRMFRKVERAVACSQAVMRRYYARRNRK